MSQPGRALQVSGDVLAGEIEFAIAYFRACNPGRDLTGEDRAEFARMITGMLFERAEQGLPGMMILAETGNRA
jgi:hypothetical protein